MLLFLHLCSELLSGKQGEAKRWFAAHWESFYSAREELTQKASALHSHPKAEHPAMAASLDNTSLSATKPTVTIGIFPINFNEHKKEGTEKKKSED